MRSGLAARLSSDYGMAFALVLLCLYYSWATLEVQHPNGPAGAARLADRLRAEFPHGGRVLIATSDGGEDGAFADSLRQSLAPPAWTVVEVVKGEPSAARQALQRLADGGQRLDVIAANQASAGWGVFGDLGKTFPSLAAARVLSPPSHRWPNFLKTDNLLNVANQIAVIAVIAVGMTLVIIAGGIDLSVGSLIALAAVVAALLIRELGGGETAPAAALWFCSLAAIALCGVVGTASGLAVTALGIPAFIVTLAMMLVASGLAFLLARGQSIYQLPDSFVWLGRGATLGLPNGVWLMLSLYAAAHVFMSRSVWGRFIYAVGGNPEAARLSGVPVARVRIFTYAVSGLLAGLGGVVMASQLKSGAPTYGQMYELYVIAAVVVGGTSLAGGQGKVLGTLIGAFIIAVIQNGMNLTGVESYTQKVVLGAVILGAVMLDLLKRRGWRFGRA